MLVSREVLEPSSAEAQVSFCKRAVSVQAMASVFGGTAGVGGPWAALSPAAAPSQCSGRGTGGCGTGREPKGSSEVEASWCSRAWERAAWAFRAKKRRKWVEWSGCLAHLSREPTHSRGDGKMRRRGEKAEGGRRGFFAVLFATPSARRAPPPHTVFCPLPSQGK